MRKELKIEAYYKYLKKIPFYWKFSEEFLKNLCPLLKDVKPLQAQKNLLLLCNFFHLIFFCKKLKSEIYFIIQGEVEILLKKSNSNYSNNFILWRSNNYQKLKYYFSQDEETFGEV